MDQGRIKFYGIHDMGIGRYLHMIEDFFQHRYDVTSTSDVNTILELFNVKKYLDSGAGLVRWSAQQAEEYKNKWKTIPQVIGRFCGTLSDANFCEVYSTVENIYAEDFWEMICIYKVYVRICPKVLERILERDEKTVWLIIRHKELSAKYGQVIAMHLVHNSHTAEKLMTNFLGEIGRAHV